MLYFTAHFTVFIWSTVNGKNTHTPQLDPLNAAIDVSFYSNCNNDKPIEYTATYHGG